MVLELGFLGPTEIQQEFAGFRSTLASTDVFQRPGKGDVGLFCLRFKRGKIPIVTNNGLKPSPRST